MSLPIEIQMQIDLTAAAHSRAVAEGFAAARKRLEPPPRKLTDAERLMQALSNSLPYMAAQCSMYANQANPFLGCLQNDVRANPRAFLGSVLTSPSADPASTARSC